MTAILDRLRSSKKPVPVRTQTVLNAITNQRRRRVIIDVDDRETAVSLADVAEIIAAAEHEKHRDLLSAAERKRVYVPLYQTHVPRLHDAGLVSYNEETGYIGPSKATEPAADLIREIEDRCLSVKTSPES